MAIAGERLQHLRDGRKDKVPLKALVAGNLKLFDGSELLFLHRCCLYGTLFAVSHVGLDLLPFVFRTLSPSTACSAVGRVCSLVFYGSLGPASVVSHWPVGPGAELADWWAVLSGPQAQT